MHFARCHSLGADSAWTTSCCWSFTVEKRTSWSRAAFDWLASESFDWFTLSIVFPKFLFQTDVCPYWTQHNATVHLIICLLVAHVNIPHCPLHKGNTWLNSFTCHCRMSDYEKGSWPIWIQTPQRQTFALVCHFCWDSPVKFCRLQNQNKRKQSRAAEQGPWRHVTGRRQWTLIQNFCLVNGDVLF